MMWAGLTICLAGCAKSIISKFDQKEMKLPLRNSDVIILSVDIDKKTIDFYQNKEHIRQ